MSSNLISYIPDFLHEIKDLKELFRAEDTQIDEIYLFIDDIKDNIFIHLADEETIIKWEKLFKIEAAESISQRANNVLSFIRGNSKLNEITINGIVNAATGGSAISRAESNTLYVQIIPPNKNYEINLSDILKVLENRKPVHLRLIVKRYYSTWDDIKNNFRTWNEIKSLKDWGEVMNYIKILY